MPASGVVGAVTVGLTVWHALMPSIDEVFADPAGSNQGGESRKLKAPSSP